MKTLKEKIEVMQAALDGKEIEFRLNEGDRWMTCNKPSAPSWDWPYVDYRIKPEPLEGWCNIYGSHAFGFYETKEEAEEAASSNVIKTIKLREVTDE